MHNNFSSFFKKSLMLTHGFMNCLGW